MSKKKRGRERTEICGQCGRNVPRDKAIVDNRKVTYSTELDGEDNVQMSRFVTKTYCISCAKRLGVLEKKKKQAARKRQERYR